MEVQRRNDRITEPAENQHPFALLTRKEQNYGNKDIQGWHPLYRGYRAHDCRVLTGLAGGAAPTEGAPNVLFFVLDDVGYGQLSSFGGLVETPVLDSVAANGLRYSNMHTTALCSPSRGCILTGRNHHSIGLASITETSTGYPGYNGALPFDRGMISEMLAAKGLQHLLYRQVAPDASRTHHGRRPL